MNITVRLRDMPAMMFPQSVIDREVDKVIPPGGEVWDVAKAVAKTLAGTLRRMVDMGNMIYGPDPVYSSDEYFRWMVDRHFRELLFRMACTFEDRE